MRATSVLRDVMGRLARFPLLYKLLVANGILVLAASLVSVWLAMGPLNSHAAWSWALLGTFVAIGLGATMLINLVLLWAALQPVRILGWLAGRLQSGDFEARAQLPFFGDPGVDLLLGSVNRVLDEMSSYRRQLHDLSSRVTEQLEKERASIARELHDDTAQSLAAMLVMERNLLRTAEDEEQRKRLEDLRAVTSTTMENVRRLSVGLRPAILDDTGLAGALRWYTEEFIADRLPKVEIDMDGSLGRLPALVELSLYRIAQEALHNVIRHAKARSVRVTLRRQPDSVELRIADDGAGFDQAAGAVDAREHLGLFTMRERARLAGGTLSIASQPGKGTTVTARLPL